MQKVAIIGAGHAGLLALRECIATPNLDPICFEVSFQPVGLYHKINQNLFIHGYRTVGEISEELQQIPVDKVKYGSKVVCIKTVGNQFEVIVKKRAKKSASSADIKGSCSTDNLLSSPISPEFVMGSDLDTREKTENSEWQSSPPSKPKSFFKRYFFGSLEVPGRQGHYRKRRGTIHPRFRRHGRLLGQSHSFNRI